MKFTLGDKVQKVSGYSFTGVVVSAFRTLDGKERYVVQCTVPGAWGMLHIYSPDQLAPLDP